MATKNSEATDMKVAVAAISAFTNAEASTKRARKKRQTKQQMSLEVFKNLSSEECQSPFQLASEGKLEELKTFIEAIGSAKERDENGATLIHHAAASNQIAIMQYLI